ncbi:hypothetical protein [Actinomadura madurae]|uniref:hypothetical protein n=1 Tax=Actinomadura madurae TaxID=1993 RepID=UPI0020D21E4A|nr:hypothetical protein [Actinomadura madurae]MCQ0010981.1 hypothetical protein [Actinomadura madurae]
MVGIGSTPYYKRGASLPQTKIEMACKAILAACEDAGLSVEDVDGFAYYSGGSDTALIAQTLGIPEVRFTGTLTGGGGGAAGSVGLAAAAITSGHANVVVSLMTLQQVTGARFGAAFASKGGGTYSRPVGPEMDFVAPHGLFAPGRCSRCWPGGTCTATARVARRSPRSRSAPARTRSTGRPRGSAIGSRWTTI